MIASTNKSQKTFFTFAHLSDLATLTLASASFIIRFKYNFKKKKKKKKKKSDRRAAVEGGERGFDASGFVERAERMEDRVGLIEQLTCSNAMSPAACCRDARRHALRGIVPARRCARGSPSRSRRRLRQKQVLGARGIRPSTSTARPSEVEIVHSPAGLDHRLDQRSAAARSPRRRWPSASHKTQRRRL